MRYWLRSVPATTSTVGFRKSAGKSIATLESVSWVPLGAILGVVFPALTLLFTILSWRLQRNRQQGVPPSVHLYGSREYPKIHATNGVPTMQQLTKGMELDAKRRGLAQAMYNLGLKQFNHYVNNRDGIIAEARDKMNELSNRLSEAEISFAEDVGIALATDVDDDVSEAQIRLRGLEPEAQIYALSKRHEYEALQTIARDLECDVPRTDFTSVKSRIASGDVPLDAITSELPITWQGLMTIDEKLETFRQSGKPPRQEFFPVMFLTRDSGVLVDKKAERDGKWLISHKHRMTVPYQDPVRIYEFERADAPPVFTGKRTIIINQDPGTEWQTELWRKGGYLDQRYLRSKAGQEPEQLRKAYRNRQIRRIAWGINAILFAIILIVFFEQYIQ